MALGRDRHARGCGRRKSGAAVLLTLLWLGAQAQSVAAAADPRSALRRPDEPGVVYVAGHLSLGGTLNHDWLRGGGGVSLIFRPQAAADLFGPLYDWNTALVLQGDWRSVASDRRLFGIGLMLRRYVRDRRVEATGSSPFIGVGLGGAQGTFPTSDGVGGSARSWHWLGEVGWETSPDDASVFFARAQWHFWRGSGLDYTGWSLQFGAGIPIPW